MDIAVYNVRASLVSEAGNLIALARGSSLTIRLLLDPVCEDDKLYFL